MKYSPLKTCLIGLLLCLLFHLTSNKIFDYSHKIGDQLSIQAGSLTSSGNLLPYSFFRLNICRPPFIQSEEDNLGEILTGEKKYKTLYTTNIKEDKYCQALCVENFSSRKVTRFKYMYRKKYVSNWFLDGLPAVLLKYNQIIGKSTIDYFTGIPLGYDASTPMGRKDIFVYNHYQFRILVHKTGDDTYEIVGFNILPLSIKQDKTPNCAEKQEAIFDNFKKEKQKLEVGDILFTYDIIYEESNLTLASRWDHYKPKNKDIHLFGVITSNILIFIFSIVVALIFCWVIRKDADLFNTRVINDEILDEYGWKQVCNDVFRPCRKTMLYATCIGTGVQLSFMLILTLIIGILGFMQPEKRGGLLTLGILLFVFMGIPGGYISTRIYKVLSGKYWLKTALLTAVFFPGITFVLYSILNILLAIENSSAAVSFSELFSLLILWLCCSSPLVIIGAFFGIKTKPLKIPCKINALPTTIPPKPWYFQFKFTFWVAGILSFSAFFIELVYIMASIWKHQIYFMATFLVIAVIIMMIICAELTIILIFINLCRGDYNWWWKSFFFGGSSAIFVVLYSFYYFFTLKITRFSAILLYFGLMGLISAVIFFIGGSFATLSTFVFIKTIYSLIKVD